MKEGGSFINKVNSDSMELFDVPTYWEILEMMKPSVRCPWWNICSMSPNTVTFVWAVIALGVL